jgi:hypothetical protein
MIADFLRKPHGAESFWVTKSHSAIEDIPSFVRSKMHCFIHKWPPLYPVLSQITPVHIAQILATYLF